MSNAPLDDTLSSTKRFCSCLCRDKAQHLGRRLVAKLKEQLSQNLFEVAIQAAANGKVVARETLKVSPLLCTRQKLPTCWCLSCISPPKTIYRATRQDSTSKPGHWVGCLNILLA